MNPILKLQAINMAIWIRDNSRRVDRAVLVEQLQNLAEYELFSNRQMERICGGIVSHTTIAGYTRKSTKTGGRLNPDSLELIREIMFMKHDGRIAYDLIGAVLDAGTSQNMLSRLTGVAQSTISKHFGA